MVKTLIEAIVLVVVVMFVFLQNWRATLIPAIAVPVVLLGTFGVLAAFGYSINTLTMFAMVLAIGLLVDDAIVVVENVERVMSEEGLSPREATSKSMDEITGALVGIALVLSAVFLPMAFFGGSTGVIYRQFSVTIVSAMVLSVLVALILTPALCATLLKPVDEGPGATQRGFFGWFNRSFDRDRRRATSARLERMHRAAAAGADRLRRASSRCMVAAVRAPAHRLPARRGPGLDVHPGHAAARRHAVAHASRSASRSSTISCVDEKDNVDGVFTVAGFSFAGDGPELRPSPSST